MDFRNYLRPIITGLVGLGLIVVVIVLIIKAFSGVKGTATSLLDLSKYANTNAVATLTIDTPTNLDQDHRQVRISVSQTSTEIDIIDGYQGTVAATRTYPNNPNAYAVFLQSLKQLNYAKGNTDPANADERGFCAAGNRYVYQFADANGKQLFRYWSTSCGDGTFGGSRYKVQQLFERQIHDTDFNSLTNSLPLGV